MMSESFYLMTGIIDYLIRIQEKLRVQKEKRPSGREPPKKRVTSYLDQVKLQAQVTYITIVGSYGV